MFQAWTCNLDVILAYPAACKTETEEPFASYNCSNKQQTTQGGAHWENGAGVFFVNDERNKFQSMLSRWLLFMFVGCNKETT